MEKSKAVKELSNRDKGWRFLKRTFVIFVVLVVTLTALNLSPLGIRELNNAFFSLFINDERNELKKVIEVSGIFTEPKRISIQKIGVDIKVLNPTSTDIKVLDAALLSGAVRYPGTGDLESKRNMFIFGHSSYLPVVHNQAFRAFNRLQELKVGDEIKLYSKDKVYVYQVATVKLTTAEAEFVNLEAADRQLILSTCNTFGKKQERYVVTSNFVRSESLVSSS